MANRGPNRRRQRARQGGRGSGLLVLVLVLVKMVLLCYDMYSHIYILVYTTPSWPYLSANNKPAILYT